MSIRTGFDADQQDVIDGWSTFCESLADVRHSIDEAGHVPDGTVRETMIRVAADGWLYPAVSRDEEAVPFTTLVGMAEAGTDRTVPVPGPVIETWCGLRLLSIAGPDAEALVEPIVSGGGTITMAADTLDGPVPGARSGLVPWATASDHVIAVAPIEPDAWALHVVPLGDLELRCSSDIDVTAPGSWFGTDELGPAVGILDDRAVEDALARYLVLQCGEMIGAADSLIHSCLEFLGGREQFGRRLATFQALQHRLADLYVALETARSLTYYAAWSVDADREIAAELTMMAKGFSADAAVRIGDEAIQLHGGYGFTWEQGLHFRSGRILLRSIAGRSARDCRVTSGRRALERGTMLTLSTAGSSRASS